MARKPANKEFEVVVRRLLNDQAMRVAVTRESHAWFLAVYFHDHLFYETGDFQKEIIALTEDDSIPLLVIAAFRGSAKSTICTTSYPIWAILGRQEKKFVAILSQSQEKAQNHLGIIKHHLENNELLIRDLGPFREERNQFGVHALELPKFGAKIATGSLEQSIRGIRYREHRPDVLVIDDIEQMEAMRKLENRDKVFRYLTHDVIPAGGKNKRVIIVGNKLHDDSPIMRLKYKIENGIVPGVYREYAAVDANGNIAWPGKYPTRADLEKEKGLDEAAYEREFMLRSVPDGGTVVKREHLHFYGRMPDFSSPDYVRTYLSIDPAVSESQSADYTAMVMLSQFGHGEDMRIYVHKDPVNERLPFHKICERALLITRSLGGGVVPRIIVEDVGAQTYIVEELKRAGASVEPFRVFGDKRSRLNAVVGHMAAKRIFFPEKGAEILIDQLLNFPGVSHDDLVDAYSMGVLKILAEESHMPRMWIFSK